MHCSLSSCFIRTAVDNNKIYELIANIVMLRILGCFDVCLRTAMDTAVPVFSLFYLPYTTYPFHTYLRFRLEIPSLKYCISPHYCNPMEMFFNMGRSSQGSPPKVFQIILVISLARRCRQPAGGLPIERVASFICYGQVLSVDSCFRTKR